jgi:carboxylesterase type B
LLFPFGPTIEPDLPGAYITKQPSEVLSSGEVNDVTTMIGQVTREGLLYIESKFVTLSTAFRQHLFGSVGFSTFFDIFFVVFDSF